MTTAHPLASGEIESRLVEIEKTAELAGHEPNAANMDRCRRILRGELTLEEAHAEIESKYHQYHAPGN
ncbi:MULTISPECIES: hypothetical protein [unclassified Cryobacterium]|uniref:hypothetical protein n=1 Tax=unclassified Cryobacterium TaxID=2649013 RepID=UPI0010692C1D|nr:MULTISPECIES: hypothetical protein [unclassified Cryobacterium]TFB96262.1 hypothetical protein E3O39_09150 [Cryobacterium sp. MDB2-A-1]TFC12547.1 hypothetical protein E3O35_06315 [Cryobacterium sp. MDB2-A-2]